MRRREWKKGRTEGRKGGHRGSRRGGGGVGVKEEGVSVSEVQLNTQQSGQHARNEAQGARPRQGLKDIKETRPGEERV